MIGAGRVEFDREARGSGARELLGVDSRREVEIAAGSQNCASLRDREGSAIAEHIAEFREARFSHRWDHSPHYEIDPRAWALLKFTRDHMGAQKRSDDFKRLLSLQFAQKFQSCELIFPIQAVAALRF